MKWENKLTLEQIIANHPFCLFLSAEEVPSLMSAAALTCFYS